jgi:hypothetical protein
MGKLWRWLIGVFYRPPIIRVVTPIDDEGPLAFPTEFAKAVSEIYERPTR